MVWILFLSELITEVRQFILFLDVALNLNMHIKGYSKFKETFKFGFFLYFENFATFYVGCDSIWVIIYVLQSC